MRMRTDYEQSVNITKHPIIEFRLFGKKRDFDLLKWLDRVGKVIPFTLGFIFAKALMGFAVSKEQLSDTARTMIDAVGTISNTLTYGTLAIIILLAILIWLVGRHTKSSRSSYAIVKDMENDSFIIIKKQDGGQIRR